MQDSINSMPIFYGCEFATFHAKAGVLEESLIAASKKVEQVFLCEEKGFIHHALLKGKDGLWADFVMAQSQEDAERICKNFMENSACLEYLQLIAEESVNITFWSRSK